MHSYDRLSALDRSFLDIEKRNTHMHVGATCTFEAAELAGSDGGIDTERIRQFVEARLHLMPRFRQRIAYVPLENHPIWVDDDQFNIRYHVRHTSLPKPGDERQLKRLAGWIYSQQLDRGKPLWEMWVIEGLEGGRFAIINKTHHCMIDGLAGADLLGVLLSPIPCDDIGEPHRWHPRPAPGATRLIREAVTRRMWMPLTAAHALLDHPRQVWDDAVDLVASLTETASAALLPASETPINRVISSHRRFDWLQMNLSEVKAIKNRLGGTVNDVVLAVVSGAMRRFLELRGAAPDQDPGFVFRAFCPVGLHASSRHGATGNFVSAMIAELPVEESDAVCRLKRIHEMTRERKDGAGVRGTEVLELFADWAAPTLVGTLARLLEGTLAYNIIVTNIPGPQLPLYLLRAPMVASYPLVPLFGHQGVGIALLSYDGKLCWGLSADRDIVPDLHELVGCIEAAYAELREAAGLLAVQTRPKVRGPEPKEAVAHRHHEPLYDGDCVAAV